MVIQNIDIGRVLVRDCIADASGLPARQTIEDLRTTPDDAINHWRFLCESAVAKAERVLADAITRRDAAVEFIDDSDA